MKKFGVPIIVGLLIGGVLSVGYLWWTKKNTSPKPVFQNQAVTTKPIPALPLLTWNDPNGFSFQYPEGLTINKHDEDKENYAHIEFTHPEHSGRIIIWGKDIPSKVTDLASWVKSDTRFLGASTLDTEMGRQPAKKVMVTGNPQILVVGTVYDRIIWSVEATFEEPEYWAAIFTSITNSFTFVTSKSDTAATENVSSDAAAASEDTPVDEEEVVE